MHPLQLHRGSARGGCASQRPHRSDSPALGGRGGQEAAGAAQGRGEEGEGEGWDFGSGGAVPGPRRRRRRRRAGDEGSPQPVLGRGPRPPKVVSPPLSGPLRGPARGTTPQSSVARGENDQVSTIRLVDPGEDARKRTPQGHWWAPGRAWDRWRVCVEGCGPSPRKVCSEELGEGGSEGSRRRNVLNENVKSTSKWTCTVLGLV